MKLILISAILFSPLLAFTQDSLEVIKLPFEILDSNTIKNVEPMTNDKSNGIVCFGSTEGIKLAYCLEDKNKWIVFSVPFTTPVVSVQKINLDGKGQREIIVEGSISDYGSGGGYQTGGMLIINTDSVPTQIFQVFFSCSIEDFGRYGSSPSSTGYGRKILIRHRQIVVSPFQKKKRPDPCDVTNLPSGIYIMVDGKIKKK